MKVGRSFSTSAVDRVELTFLCVACHYTSPVTVRAEGTGQATAWLFLGQRSAQQRASERATRDVGHQARALAELATCPACGKVNAGAWRINVLRAVVEAPLTLAAFWGVAYLFRDEWFLLVLLPIAGLYASVSTLVQRLSLPSRAREQVSFVRPPERAPTQQSSASLWRGPD